MLTKFLITAVVIGIAYLVLRSRSSGTPSVEDGDPASPGRKRPLIPTEALKTAAYAVFGIMITGSALYLYQSWERQHQVVDVQVVNPYNGQVQHYEARRGDFNERSFRTLDGRLIRIAEMERLVIDERR